MSNFHVLTIGSAVRDVFLQSPGFTVLRSAKFASGYGECVALGSKVEVESCVFATGGGATNAAVTFAHLGFAADVLAKIGDDEAGVSILDDLKKHGVGISFLKKERKGNTGYSTLLTTDDGERTALVFRGVSAEWKSSDIPQLPENLKAIYVTSLGGNMEVLEKVLERAKKKGIFVALNPGSAEIGKGSSLMHLLPLVSLLILNKEEAQLLTAKANADVPTLAATFHRACPLVVITDGAQGSYAHDATHAWFARSSAVTSVSRTGAGDAFGSAFTAAILSGMDTQTALQIGTLNAEQVIQHVGAKAGILRAWPSNALRARIRVTSARV
jgi:sugar/nucleoside kinase (ribokinase family)